MCDICFCILLANKSQHASSHIDRVDTSRCAISSFVFSWPTNHNMHHRTSSIVATKNCAISGPLLNEDHHHTWVLEFGQNISIYFESFRFGGMKLIACPNSSTHVWWWSSLSRGPEIAQFFCRYYARCAISVFVFYCPDKSQHASSHIDRVDTSRCAIAVSVFSWPENHNMHHRTSAESRPVGVR